MLPDFNRLKVFYYIYSLESIVAAAKALNLSQPGISQHLRNLEAEIKVPLFIRLYKKIIPTPAGKQLFKIIEPFVEELRDGIQNIRYPYERPSGKLRMGAPPVLGMEYIPQICQSFRTQHPDVFFSLKLDDSNRLLSLLKDGKLDFILADVYLSNVQLQGYLSMLSIEPLVEEELILTCSRDYYHQNIKNDHSFNNLINQSYIIDEHDDLALQYWFKHHFNKSVENLNVSMEVNSHQTVIEGVKLGLGIGITASHMIWEEINDGKIIPITTGGKETVNRISLIQIQNKIPSLTEKTFQAFLKKELSRTEVLQRFIKISDQQSNKPT